MSDAFDGESASSRADAAFSYDKFYVASENSKGSRDQWRINFPPGTSAKITRLANLGIIPEYRNQNDVIRDALIKGLHHIEEVVDDPAFTHEINLFTVSAEIERIKVRNQIADDRLKDLREMLPMCRSDEEKRELVQQAEYLLQSEEFVKSPARAKDLRDIINANR